MNREYFKQYFKRTRECRKRYALDRLGNKCCKCGKEQELEFDHIDRNTKEYNISSILSLSLEKLNLELEKCQLLCYDCHKIKTIKEATKILRHGTMWCYRKGKCRCVRCKKVMRDYKREYRKRQCGEVA